VPYLKEAPLSFETLIWVRTQKTGSPVQRSVLRVLADHAGQDHSCYLKTRLIADETDLSDSAVRKALMSLIEKGLVRVYERYHSNGARRTNRYQVLAEGVDTPEPDAEDWADVRQRCADTPSPTEQGDPLPGGGGGLPGGGGTLSQVEGFPYTEAPKEEAPVVKGRAARPATATRVPDNFWPDEKMRAWFDENCLGDVINGKTEHEKFMDYFRAAPGIKGRKTDWPATWRNWMRNAAERAERRPGTALMPPSGRPNALDPIGVPYRPSTTDQRVGQAMALAAKYEEQGL